MFVYKKILLKFWWIVPVQIIMYFKNHTGPVTQNGTLS